MPILPIRNLGQIGVVKDVNSYDLPPNGISRGVNIRFDDGKIKRSNVFRKALTLIDNSPAFTFTYEASGDIDKIGIADKNGSVYFYQNSVLENVTDTGWVSANSEEPYTYTYLQGVGYLNRVDQVPRFYKSGSTDFATLTNWTSTWRCKSLRAFKDYLLALNVTKGTTEYPSMVAWSDIAQYNAVPSSWDASDTTKSAGDNIIGELKTPLQDAVALGNVMILYSQDQVWMMEETGDAMVFRFRKLFDDRNMINTNCAVAIEGKHYVFGVDDIYVHDGNSSESIIDGRNWEFVFQNLSKSQIDKFFVTHNPLASEVVFCYTAGDDDTAFKDTDYCNRGAVFNYKNNTWSFVDLPNVSSATLAGFSVYTTYTTATAAWGSTGGTWYDQESTSNNAIFMTGERSLRNGLTFAGLYGYEPANNGVLPFDISTGATKPAVVERVGLDMDDSGEELRAYKVIKSIYPQLSVTDEGQTLDFQFSSSAYANAPFKWSAKVSHSPVDGYKVDTREGGRYLAYRLTTNDLNDFNFSGFDADVVSTGRR